MQALCDLLGISLVVQFKNPIDQFLAGVPLPRAKNSVSPKLALPDVTGTAPLAGVRIYLTFGANKLNHYRTPTVEAVPTTKALRDSLRYPMQPTSLKAEALQFPR